MNKYIDVTLLPDEDMSLHELMSRVYFKLHKGLCNINSNTIGVSFPNTDHTLGDIIRLHGWEEDLLNLEETNWLGGLIGYCNKTGILNTPESTSHYIVSQKRKKYDNARMKRLIKEGRLVTDEQIKEYNRKIIDSRFKKHYIEMMSSSGNKYIRCIQTSDVMVNATIGQFNTFGLSKTASVPYFKDTE